MAKVQDIILTNDENHPFFTVSTLSVTSISFSREETHHVKLLWILTAFYIISGLLIIMKRKKSYSKYGASRMIFKKLQIDDKVGPDPDFLIDYIKTNYSDCDLSLGLLSSVSFFPERKISTIIKEKTGLNFSDYVKQLRIIKAKELLTNTDAKIIDIAYNSGYNTINNFNYYFKEETGMTPMQYRLTHGKENVK